MNQLVGKTLDGTPFLLLVLEPGNLHKLKVGEPIKVRIEDLFPDGIPKRLELGIWYSETPVADARAYAKHAEVVLDERGISQKRPHCPECHSTIEQFAVLKNESPIVLAFCPVCGCALGIAAASAFAREGVCRD